MTSPDRPAAPRSCDRNHAALRAAVAHPEFSHATVRRDGSLWQHIIWLYRRDSTSPTQVKLGFSESGDDRCDECLSICTPRNGPTRGAIAEGLAS